MKHKQKVGLKRNTIDKYYTKNIIVEICLSLVKKFIKVSKDDVIIEPSAGNGSFIDGIKTMSPNHIFYDLEPDNNAIIKQDYLQLNVTSISDKYNKIHIIGNPPFGRQSSLAKKFIKKSCKYCDSVSFILPKSFKKDSMKKHFPLNFHLIFELDLPNNSFLVNKKEHSVPCVFQVWEKKDINRKTIKKLIPKNFAFVKKNENHDISFRRVGVNAGNIDRNTSNKSPQSHYFIKFKTPFNDTLFEKLSKLKFNCSNYTVGPKSISKQELIKEFNTFEACIVNV